MQDSADAKAYADELNQMLGAPRCCGWLICMQAAAAAQDDKGPSCPSRRLLCAWAAAAQSSEGPLGAGFKCAGSTPLLRAECSCRVTRCKETVLPLPGRRRQT